MQPVERLKRLPAPPDAFESHQSTREAPALQQQFTSTLLKPAGTNFKQLDLLVFKPLHPKLIPQTNKMTSVPPGVPTFTLADMEQIVALAVQIALVEAQGLPPANNRPIVNLTPVTAF